MAESPESPLPADVEPLSTEPEVLHPRVRLVWAAGAVVLGVVILVVGWLVERFVAGRLEAAVEPVWFLAGAAIVGALGVVFAFLRYRIWRFELQDDALYLERGVLTRVETSVPYVRVQHIDTHRGPVERLVGLSSVVVYTAGSRGADVTVPGLAPERARRLRDRLRDLAVASETGDAV
mgnify:CR=1 FL=1